MSRYAVSTFRPPTGYRQGRRRPCVSCLRVGLRSSSGRNLGAVSRAGLLVTLRPAGAGKVEKAANGSRCGVIREPRRKVEVPAPRSFEAHGGFDDREKVEAPCKCQAAEAPEPGKLEPLSFVRWPGRRHSFNGPDPFRAVVQHTTGAADATPRYSKRDTLVSS